MNFLYVLKEALVIDIMTIWPQPNIFDNFHLMVKILLDLKWVFKAKFIYWFFGSN